MRGNPFSSHDLTASEAEKNPGKVICSLKVSLKTGETKKSLEQGL